MSSVIISTTAVFGLKACSSATEPSCKDSTAIETLRENIEQNLISTQLFGDNIRVTKIEGSPIERKQFGLVCRALVEISNADISVAINQQEQAGKIVKPFQINQTYSVDVIDGELVTRSNLSNLFQVVGMAAALTAAQQAGVTLPGHSPGKMGR